MISTALALLAAASVASASPAPAASVSVSQANGPLTAAYDAASGRYCVRSGWISAFFRTGRMMRVGDCGTAMEWRRRGVAFTPPVATDLRITSR